MDGIYKLMAQLMYGSGLRLMEVMRLRVKDLDFGNRQIIVRDGKGENDRVTMFPDVLLEPLRLVIRQVKAQHDLDLARATVRSIYPMPWNANTRTPTGNSPGNTSSPRPFSPSTPSEASSNATI